MSKAQKFHDQLKRDKIRVLLDDRNEQAGVKFKDADLIGIYLQVIISKDLLNKGNIEIRLRTDKESLIKKEDQLMKEVARIVRK
jgi:prolyl-tRNA synthetase